jgi:hypothetical protein
MIVQQTNERLAGEAPASAPVRDDAPAYLLPKRLALTSLTALVAVNIWTGFPLLALWVGSRTVPQRGSDSGVSMASVFVVVAVLAILAFAGVYALTWMSSKYDELTGRPIEARRTSPWLRSMRGEREELVKRRLGISVVERIVILSVVGCVLAFEVWFFFFAGPPLLS